MKKKSYKNEMRLAFFGLIAGVCNGLFGSGGGMIAVPALEKTAQLDAKKAHATALGVILPMALVSIFKYSSFGNCDIITLSAVCVGGILGSITGAKLMKRFTAGFIKRFFAVVMLITAFRMVIM